MQCGGIHVNESSATGAGSGAVYQERISLINGLSALSFLMVGLMVGGAEILILLFGHNHSAADLLQAIVIAGLSFGLCILAVKLTPAL